MSGRAPQAACHWILEQYPAIDRFFLEGNFATDKKSSQINMLRTRGTRVVAWITAVMRVVEITAGWWFHSMALLADGWHMSTHTIAIGLAAFAYSAARRYARDPRFAFGTWKIEVLGGFASAIFLLGVAAMMVWESVGRLFSPQTIHYQQAREIAALGLLVNIVSALILGHAHDHHHHHEHAHDEHEAHAHHHDLNLKSAYVHVIADAATSVLAITALAGGWFYGWSWLDPAIGIVGAMVVASWARNLLRETGKVLLDREMDHGVVDEVKDAVARFGDAETRIADLHVWRVGKAGFACILSLVTHDPALTPERVKTWLARHGELAHVTVEIHRCGGADTNSSTC